MIQRELEAWLRNLAGWFPIVSVTGPRQSGKSTLVQAAFSEYDCINLEDPATRERAVADPSGFVAHLSNQTIIDEAQYVPNLFPALQAKADQEKKKGQFILTGSQNYLLSSSIKESLAGRVGIARLLPLSYLEIKSAYSDILFEQVMLQGSYPGLYADNIPVNIFYSNYIDTYITRDVVGLLDVRKESQFRAFLKACAARVGNLVNYSDLSRDVGIALPTVKDWLSILEASYVVKQLPAYSRNISKRVAKSPKLFFYDTGLLCYLLELTNVKSLYSSPYYGAVFENYIISEQFKNRFNSLLVPDIYFYRDDSKIEVDMIDVTEAKEAIICEIKSSQTFSQSFVRNVNSVVNVSGLTEVLPAVVYGGEGTFECNDVYIYGINEWLLKRHDKELSGMSFTIDGRRYRCEWAITDRDRYKKA